MKTCDECKGMGLTRTGPLQEYYHPNGGTYFERPYRTCPKCKGRGEVKPDASDD